MATGLIAKMHSSELDRLDAGSWFAPKFAGERLPRLDDFFASLKDQLGFMPKSKMPIHWRLLRPSAGQASKIDVLHTQRPPRCVPEYAQLLPG